MSPELKKQKKKKSKSKKLDDKSEHQEPQLETQNGVAANDDAGDSEMQPVDGKEPEVIKSSKKSKKKRKKSSCDEVAGDANEIQNGNIIEEELPNAAEPEPENNSKKKKKRKADGEQVEEDGSKKKKKKKRKLMNDSVGEDADGTSVDATVNNAMVTEEVQDEKCIADKKKKKKNKKKGKKQEQKDSEPTSQETGAATNEQEEEEDVGEVEEDVAEVEEEQVQKSSSNAFRRVKDEVWLGKSGSFDNSYEGTFGQGGYGFKAQEKLGKVRGKDFRHEKTKKKKSTYRGGAIDFAVNSMRFDSD